MAIECRRAGRAGFTLVELLIAVFIFGIVISSVYGSYRATFSIVDGAEARLKMSSGAVVVMERFSDDLTAIVAGPGGALNGEKQEHLGSRGDKIAFVSLAHLALTENDSSRGWILIEYSVEPDEKSGMLQLFRAETILLPGVAATETESEKYVICRELQEVRFTYLDENGNIVDEWQSDGDRSPEENGSLREPQLPGLVYMELKFAESMESDRGTVFKTAVALPRSPRERG